MRFLKNTLVSVCLALSLGSALTKEMTTQTRVILQAAMQTHIDRTTISGVYPKLDLASGKVTKLHPATGHPMILSMGEYYVLCADFRDADGRPVNIDFYMAPSDKGYTVFQVEVANRAPLEALMKAGKALMVK